MPPEINQGHREKPLKEQPTKPQSDEFSTQYDTAGRPLFPHELDSATRQQVQDTLDESNVELAKDLVTTKIEITGDIDGEWNRIIDNLIATAEKANALEKNSHNETIARNQIKQLRFELQALAGIKARHNVLTQISDGREPSTVLEQVTQSRKLHSDRLGTNTDMRARIEGAAILILRKAEQHIAKDIVANPDRLEELHAENKELFDNVLRHSGAQGGTHEISFTPSKKITIAEHKLKEFDLRIKKIEKRIKELSWFEKTFGKEGKILRTRQKEMQTERKALAAKAATELISKALSTEEARQALAPKHAPDDFEQDLPEANLQPIETTWEEYQAQLASLHSLQEKRASLSRLPWKHRAEKKQLDTMMFAKDEQIKKLKAAHAAEIKEKNLAREQELEKLRKEKGL